MTRLAGRLVREEKRLKEDDRRWLIGMWIEAKARHHALVADQPTPQTKADEKKKPSEHKISEAKRFRKEHDSAWYEALSGPAHLGEFVGLSHIFGPVKRPKPKSREEIIKNGLEAAHRALKGIFGGGEDGATG